MFAALFAAVAIFFLFWTSCQFCSELFDTATCAYDLEAVLTTVFVAVFDCFSAFLAAAIVVVAIVID